MTAKNVQVPARSAKINDAQVSGARARGAKVGGVKPTATTLKGAKSVVVNDKNGAFIREYSQEVHGADFLAHANEFASKEEGRSVVAV